MRVLVVDEAGTAEHEPVAVVAGVLLHADQHIVATEIALREVLGGVPENYRKNFQFHATSIWNDKLYKGWLMSDRLALLRNVLAIPRKLGAPISAGIVVREHRFERVLVDLTAGQEDHTMAFVQCVTRADKWIRENTHPAEVATMMVEQCGKMDSILRQAFRALRSSGGLSYGSKALVVETGREQAKGHIDQETEARVTRIRQSINFVEKKDDPLLQLADAAAFALRRYYSRQQHGETLVTALLGAAPPLQDVITTRISGYVWGPRPIRPFVVH